MARGDLRKLEPTPGLLRDVDARAALPVLHLFPARLGGHVRELLEQALLFHPVLSRVFARLVAAHLPPAEIGWREAAKERPRKPANDVEPPTEEERLAARRSALVQSAGALIKKLAREWSRKGAGDFDDLVQDASLLALGLADRYAEADASKARFTSYAFRPIVELFIDKVRREGVARRRFVHGVLERLRDDGGDPADAVLELSRQVVMAEALALHDDAWGPEERALREERDRLVAAALGALEPAEAALIQALYREGLGMRDAAARAGMSLRTAERAHPRALARMHAHVAGA